MKLPRCATFRVHMPQHARIVAAGYPMHMILRGINRAAIFFADPDRYLFLATLAELAIAESVGVHAYVLMTNPPPADDSRHRLRRVAPDEGAWPEVRLEIRRSPRSRGHGVTSHASHGIRSCLVPSRLEDKKSNGIGDSV